MAFGRQDPIKVLRRWLSPRQDKEPSAVRTNINALREKIQQKLAAEQVQEKQAFESSAIQPNPYIRLSDIAKGTAVGMAVGAGVKGVGTVLSRAIDRAYVGLTEGKDKAKAFAKMLSTSPELGKENSTKVQRAFNSLYRWNPEMARDPLVAASFVQRTIDYGAVTTQEVESMIKSRKYLGETRRAESILGGSIEVSGKPEIDRAFYNQSITLNR